MVDTQARQPKILIVGSVNMDLVVQASRFPMVGETILGSHFDTLLGGKGANQAVAASRLGAQVTLLGAVGQDDFGEMAKACLQKEGVRTDYVKTITNVPTGIAAITVAEGDNHIVVVSGANHALTVADIEAAKHCFAEADVVISQLEIPLPCVEAAAKLAQEYQKPFILNPAPAQKLSHQLSHCVTALTPNNIELKQLLPSWDGDISQLPNLPMDVILTAGSDGAFFVNEHGCVKQQTAFAVSVVDSTGAGDTFNAALAVFWSLGIEKAVYYACAAASLSVQKLGAQSAMPTLAELFEFVQLEQ